jgi:hypothetical protein
MVERLPKDCAVVVENLAKALGHDLKLGVRVECGKLGNRFKLVAADKYGKIDQKVFLVKTAYDDVNVPGIKSMLDAVWPDFMLKPTPFMPIDRLVSDFKLDKEQLAAAILKGIRGKMKKNLSTWGGKNGICVYVQKNAYYNNESFTSGEMPRFKSFSEFLVWVDLNVK